MKYLILIMLFSTATYSKDSNQEYYCKNYNYFKIIMKVQSFLSSRFDEFDSDSEPFEESSEKREKKHYDYYHKNLSRFCASPHDLASDLAAEVQYALIRNKNSLDSDNEVRPQGSNPELSCGEISAPSHIWKKHVDKLNANAHLQIYDVLNRYSKIKSKRKPILLKFLYLDQLMSSTEGQEKQICETVMREMSNVFKQYKNLD